MPYARNADLPSTVRNLLPDSAQTLFRAVVNASLRQKKDEKVAFRTAWAQVARQYKKPPNDDGKWVHKAANTLYVRRNVENANAIIKWAKEQGFDKTVAAEDMHVTLASSKQVIDWPDEFHDEILTLQNPEGRSVELLGDDAVVLKFKSSALRKRWSEFCDVYGCSWDHDDFVPHVTLSYEPGDLDLSAMKAYPGPIVLGPEIAEPRMDDYADTIVEKHKTFSLLKVNKRLGLVFGWAVISKINGEEYYDTQDDHIPEESMLEAAAEFMEKRRTLKLMHKGQKQGEVVFAWPLTSEIAKAMGLTSPITGLMVAVKPASKKILDDIENGSLTGFSIGGSRLEDEAIVEDA